MNKVKCDRCLKAVGEFPGGIISMPPKERPGVDVLCGMCADQPDQRVVITGVSAPFTFEAPDTN